MALNKIKQIPAIIKGILEHPLNKGRKTKAFFRFINFHLGLKLNPYPIVYSFTEKSKLIVGKGMHGATVNYYYGLDEYGDMLFALHFLRKNDVFVDIGANIGSFTVLASAHAGSQTIAFEPSPNTFQNLRRNIGVNLIHDNVTPYNVALGGQSGKIKFTSSSDAVNHIAVESDKNVMEVDIALLDNIMENHPDPILIKIDVEGYETEVLKGGTGTFSNPSVKAIIIELNGSGKRYGFDEDKIHEFLLSNGFNAYYYDPLQRVLSETKMLYTKNAIFIRDIPFVRERLVSAEKVRIFDKWY